MTIRQLLDHTSGLRDYFFHPAIDRILVDHPDRIWSEAESMKYVGKPYFKPGRGWHYSNTNYLVLGMVAERVGGESLADLYRERFFEPLGLDGTFYQPTEIARGPVAHGYRFSTSAKDAKPIDLTADGPVVPFASVVSAARGAGRAGGHVERRRPLGARPVRRRRARSGHGPGDARRRQPDGALPAVRALRPGRPADRGRRRAGHRALRPAARLPLGGALHARQSG